VRNLFGSGFAIAFFGLFALVCLMAAVGIRRSHVRSFLKKRLDTVSSVSQGVAQRMKAVPAAFDTQKIMAALVQPPKEREKRPRVTPRRRSTPIPELMQPAQDTAGTAQDSPQIAASVRPIRPATATGTSPEAPALRPIVSRAAMNEDVPEPESLPPVQRIGTGTSIGANTGANTGSSLPPIRRAEPAANANPTAEPEAALTPGIRRPVPIGRNPIRDTDQSTDQTGQQIGQQIGQPSDPQTGQPAASLANQEDAEPALPAPIAPKPVSTPVRARKEKPEKPAPPPRVRRTFAVSDFEEDRRVLPREGLPPLRLLADTELNKPTEQEINANARIIEDTLLEFDIDVEVVEVRVGPTVTQYGVQPFREVINEQGETVLQRVRVTKIQSYSDDLALALAAKRLRIEPYVPGHQYMGIEVPNRTPSVVALRPVLESESFAKAYIKSDPDSPTGTREAPLTVPLGRDVSGSSVIVDLATMPHVLIAGTTGSGKSVCITTLIAALVMNNTPDRVKLVMLDPKRVELSRFNGLPHLLGPVETDIEQIIGVLRWATREMDRRYKLLEGAATRNIEIYNRAVSTGEITTERLPYIVIFVDEIGDLMLSRPDETERTLTRLAQMARAVGMHLVVATQRPSVDIITGLIKANFPARISFAVTSGMDSRVILDATGAETLIGKGDMLYQASDAGGPRRVQGCFASDEEIDELVRWWIDWKARQGAATDAPPWERGLTRREALSEGDPLLEDAIALVVRDGEASPSMLQRQLGIDYRRAANLIDSLTELGVIGKLKEGGRREVLIKPGTKQYKALLESQRNKGG
jgi:DNA segregation ATPase FtsK/SpoIIIE-like protein